MNDSYVTDKGYITEDGMICPHLLTKTERRNGLS